MPRRSPIAESFHRQADGCIMLGSTFTALICRLLAERLDLDSAFAKRIANWAGNPKDDALPLRATGALHALARSGRCPPLSAAYPPHPTDPDRVAAGIAAAIAQEDAFLTKYLDSPPQTCPLEAPQFDRLQKSADPTAESIPHYSSSSPSSSPSSVSRDIAFT